MPRQGSPDYIVDADRGSGSTRAKLAETTDWWENDEREQSRDGLRDLDKRIEGMPGLTRAQKDRERILPRATTGPLGHPVMQRPLQPVDQPRVPFSSRQKKARSKARNETLERLPAVQVFAQHDLVTRTTSWTKVNDELSERTGDISEISPAQERQVRRVDRAIQAYERNNDRGHIVYANVQMPSHINSSNLASFCDNAFERGTAITFDRYTTATHQLHETSGFVDPKHTNRTAVFEIQTRRGAYLGGSDSQDNTRHLLPRGMSFEVVGTSTVEYQAPDGHRGKRVVIQLRDITPEPSRKEETR